MNVRSVKWGRFGGGNQCVWGGGETRERRRGEYDQSTLYICMRIMKPVNIVLKRKKRNAKEQSRGNFFLSKYIIFMYGNITM
jgi:hypothetical protein